MAVGAARSLSSRSDPRSLMKLVFSKALGASEKSVSTVHCSSQLQPSCSEKGMPGATEEERMKDALEELAKLR
jgi:hypothetical protein